MSFLRNEDRMILMNSNILGGYGLKFIPMGIPELTQIRNECGVTVGEEQIFWNNIEKSMGVYDWSLPDTQVNQVLKSGMRLILCAPNAVPDFFPEDWYWKKKDGPAQRIGLSFWNQAAQDYEKAFIEKVIERYSGADVSVIYHGFIGGESVMYNHPSFFDTHAIADFKQRYGQGAMPYAGTHLEGPPPFPLSGETREWLRDGVVKHHLFMQDAFRKPHNEVWDDLQPDIGRVQSEANGNFAQYDIHKAYAEMWPETEQWLLMYTYFGNSAWSAEQVDQLVSDWKCKVILEANYCEGLRDPPPTYLTAIDKGFYGQIVCPLHPFRGHTTMEPWMIDIVKTATNKWRETHS